MPHLNRTPDDRPRTAPSRWVAVPLLVAGLLASHAQAQQPGQTSFRSPEEASQALAAAAEKQDENALLRILGPDGGQLVSSGDATEDANDRARFAERYREMHRLVKEPDGTTTLYIGAKNWPTPIPLVNKGPAWYFDTGAGKQEILARRIGQNETTAIHVCQALVAAQQIYFSTQHQEYAQAILSQEGRHDGLYWRTEAGTPASPLGPLVAAALAKGYVLDQAGVMAPYGGYRFRILSRQGRHAQGGAQSYLVKGRLTKGYAIVAYPAEYRSSGVMTFLVDPTGEVLQQDLGKGTVLLAKTMQQYDPAPSWQKAEDRPVEPPVGTPR